MSLHNTLGVAFQRSLHTSSAVPCGLTFPLGPSRAVLVLVRGRSRPIPELFLNYSRIIPEPFPGQALCAGGGRPLLAAGGTAGAAGPGALGDVGDLNWL